jgi:hypothetical protein
VFAPPGRAPLLREGAVLLHTERVDRENQGLVSVVIGAEVELDPIFLGQAIAIGQRGSDRARSGVCANPK